MYYFNTVSYDGDGVGEIIDVPMLSMISLFTTDTCDESIQIPNNKLINSLINTHTTSYLWIRTALVQPNGIYRHVGMYDTNTTAGDGGAAQYCNRLH